MENQDTVQSLERKTSRQLQADQTKKRVLEVALQLVQEQGFDNVKIGDICKAAQISTGAFYHHLKSKAGIVVECYAECDAYFRDTVQPQFADCTTVEAILDYIAFQIRYAVNRGVDITLQIYKAQLTEGTEFFLLRERALPAGLTGIISRLQALGVLRHEKPAQEISEEILVITRGVLYNWCQKNGSYNPEAFARTLIGNYIKVYEL